MKKLYLIGNAHLDPVWLWQWQEGYAEVLATFRSVLDRMKEFPEFKFTSACSLYYQWIEESDPAMFKEIQTRVKEGRWCLTGGWLIQPDCNIPCGESFARHALIGQRYFKEKFGVIAKCGYNVDSFGHNANLPKILKASGMDNYIFMRPNPTEKKIKDSIFWWESDDGSKICTYRIPLSYNIRLETRFQNLSKIQKIIVEENRDMMAFYGVGNHGGGPTIQLIEAINEMNLDGALYATADEYFNSADKGTMPTIKDELQHHARGCYSAYADIKSGNRKAEQNLLAAERFCTIAKELVGEEYPANELRKAWESTLFNQFHDILGGCSIEKAYSDAKYLHHETMAITDRLINKALQIIAWNIDTIHDEPLPAYKKGGGSRVWEHEVLGTPVVVFNSHPWPVKALVSTYASATKVCDNNGREIAFQLIHADNTISPSGERHTAFVAEIPPMGYRVYRLFSEQKSTLAEDSTMKIERTLLENDVIKVTFDPDTGDILQIFDKENQKNILNRPCRALLLDESTCDTWAHDVKYLGPETAYFKNADFMIMEDGPAQITLRTTVYCENSTLQRDYTLIRGSKEIRITAKADFHEKCRTLKLAVPMEGQILTTQIPYGSIERKGESGEEPCGSWMTDGSITVANDSKYGYDVYKGEMRLTILRGAAFADHCRVRDSHSVYMDQGLHAFSYSIAPFESVSAAERQSGELNFAPHLIKGTFHKGILPECFAALEGDCAAAVISAIKKHEDSENTVLRCFEAEGKTASINLRLFGKEYKASLAPHAVKTISETDGEMNLLEWKDE